MNLTFYRGDDNTITLKFMDGDTPKDITGWTIFFTLKKKIDDSDDDAVLKKDITSHTNAAQGETEIPLLDTNTNDLAGIYHYDIQSKDDSGIIKTVIKGEINFIKDITRRIV